MHNIKLTHSIRQMFLVVTGFIGVIAFIEADGLTNWADRLQPSALRSAAVPWTAALHKLVQPLGLTAVRQRALDEAARIGWTDDAVRLAHNTTPPVALPVPCAAPGRALSPVLVAAATAPIASAVPRATSLLPLSPL